MQQNKILAAALNPRDPLHRSVVQQMVLIKEEAPEGWSSGVDQKDPETLNIKEEEEEQRRSLDVEQLSVKEETDDTRISFTAVHLKIEDDKDDQHQVKDEDLPTSSSADQMKAATGGEDCARPCRLEAPEEWSSGVDQKDPEILNIKEEEEELRTSLDVEQLGVKEATDDTRFALPAVPLKIEDDEAKPLFSQLHQHQVEDGDPPTSSSVDQMEAATGGENCVRPCRSDCLPACNDSSTNIILDPPSSPACVPAPAVASTLARTLLQTSTTQSSTIQQPAVLGKRKRVSSKDQSFITAMQAEDKLNRAQRDQHFRRLLNDARESREQKAEARNQEAAFRKEEIAQNAAFNQAFLGVLGELARAMTDRHVT